MYIQTAGLQDMEGLRDKCNKPEKTRQVKPIKDNDTAVQVIRKEDVTNQTMIKRGHINSKVGIIKLNSLNNINDTEKNCTCQKGVSLSKPYNNIIGKIKRTGD